MKTSTSFHRFSIVLAAALLIGCTSEYEIISIEDDDDAVQGCQAGCLPFPVDEWYRTGDPDQAGFSVEIAAWGDADHPKRYRSAAAGAPVGPGGHVITHELSTVDGAIIDGTRQIIGAPADAEEFGYALLASDIWSGSSRLASPRIPIDDLPVQVGDPISVDPSIPPRLQDLEVGESNVQDPSRRLTSNRRSRSARKGRRAVPVKVSEVDVDATVPVQPAQADPRLDLGELETQRTVLGGKGEELIVGAPGYGVGRIYWYYNAGSSWVEGGSYAPSIGSVDPVRFGEAIAAPHDYDANYPSDDTTIHPEWIAVGAPGVDRIYILLVDPSSATPLRSVQTISGPNDSSFGKSLAVADFNSDGLYDLAVGAPDDVGGGSVWVFQGQQTGDILDPVNYLELASPFTTAGEFGASMDAGYFRLNALGLAALVVGDPGCNADGLNDAGAIHQFQFKAVGPGFSVIWDRHDKNPDPQSESRYGQAVAVGNFVAEDESGFSFTDCALAEEVAVGEPFRTLIQYNGPIIVSVLPATGKVTLPTLGDDGVEPDWEPQLEIYGASAVETLGYALASDYVQFTRHEDLIAGMPLRDDERGGYLITKAGAPGGLDDTLSGTWTGDDSAGSPFSLELIWDGENLHIEMLSSARIFASDGVNICKTLGYAIDGTARIEFDPIPWNWNGNDHAASVTFEADDLLDPAVLPFVNETVFAEVRYESSNHTFVLELDETQGLLKKVPNGCDIEGNPFVFTQVSAKFCE